MEKPIPFWENGPAPGAMYNFPGGLVTESPKTGVITVTRTPVTTGSCVFGFHFKDGVIIAADTLASYGSLARYKDVERILKVNNNILMAAGGDYADFQYLRTAIEQKILDEECLDDGLSLKPKSLHCWLTHVMYSKRSKFDPFWNDLLIAGFDNDQPFLGTVDKLGVAYTNNTIATGFGAYLVKPLIDAEVRKNPEMTKEEAFKCVQKAMELLYFRDTRSWPRYVVGTITKDKGIEITEPPKVSGFWGAAKIGFD